MTNSEWNRDLAVSYDGAAGRYAEKFFHELERKPFDRALLDRFANSVRDRGPVCDVGCGPGHIARYLDGCGVDVFGIDISPRMIEVAARLNPNISFRQADMLALGLPDRTLAGVIAFYSLIHISRDSVADALEDWHRVLNPQGILLLSFHAGEGELHADEFLGIPVSIDATLFQPDEITEYVRQAGFTVDAVVTREPYDFEFQSTRTYISAHARVRQRGPATDRTEKEDGHALRPARRCGARRRRHPGGRGGSASPCKGPLGDRVGRRGRAELAWLDGVVAYLRGNQAELVGSLDALPDHTADRTSLLRQSLSALVFDAAGDRETAAREMLELEQEIADRWNWRGPINNHHPLLVTLNRLICVSWLRVFGREADAARPLTWHEAMPGSPLFQAWTRTIGPMSLVDRAEIAEAMAQPERALTYYTRFLDQYDMPAPALQPRVDRARAGLARLRALTDR